MLWAFAGKMFSDKDRCRACHGKKVSRENKVLEVHVDKGMKNGQKIVFHGEGDQSVCAIIFMSLVMLYSCAQFTVMQSVSLVSCQSNQSHSSDKFA